MPPTRRRWAARSPLGSRRPAPVSCSPRPRGPRRDRPSRGGRTGRPRADDTPFARADRCSRRDPLRPPRSAGRARRGPRGCRAAVRRQGAGRARAGTGGDQRPAGRAGPDRQAGRARQGWRPVRVRARRRGGRGARRGGRAVRGRARRDGGGGSAGVRRDPRDPPRRWRPRSPSSPATRTRARTAPALDWDALARFPGTLVFYMGVRNLRADRRAPRSPPTRSGGAGRGRRARHAAGPAHRHRLRSRTSPSGPPTPACAHPRSRWSGRSRACGRRSRGSSGGRCRARS